MSRGQGRPLKIMRERPGIGPAPLFPAPRDMTQPVGRETLVAWLREHTLIGNVDL
jgi:hypothetical protein